VNTSKDPKMNESVTSMASNADNAKPDSSLNLVP